MPKHILFFYFFNNLGKQYVDTAQCPLFSGVKSILKELDWCSAEIFPTEAGNFFRRWEKCDGNLPDFRFPVSLFRELLPSEKIMAKNWKLSTDYTFLQLRCLFYIKFFFIKIMFHMR